MKKNRSAEFIISYDHLVSVSYLLLCLIGVVMILDISSIQSSLVNFYTHIVYLGISLLSVILVLYFFNLDKLRPLNPWYIYITLAILILVLVKGPDVNGATRWLKVGPIRFQPSFIARMALIFYFAGFLDKKHDKIRSANLKEFAADFAPLIVYTVFIFVLIIMEKHLSTLIIGGATLLGMLFYAGVRKRLILLVLLLGLVAGALIITRGDDFRSGRLETYKVYNLFMRNRPAPERNDDQYQVRESLTALTSGYLFGTGMARGRAKHYYLPEARTDYIYTVIGEEFGFLGAIIVLGLHALLFFRAFKIAEAQENRYYKYLCAGLAMNIFLNALVNTGVAISILPSTGNTLPFISYGGTALLVDSVSIGVILNISAKRRRM
ncbi:MAG: FtsW/RodA/SpoVE family cell cycle protein [Candidatus Syntrophosphaera sp.]|nr:FtsW/RodA/SpoVE family cell cycle protein [Candidatus Syntrophosphaera sp.]